MKGLRRTLSFGKDKKEAAPRADNGGIPAAPPAAAAPAAEPSQPVSRGRRLTRSLSFSGSSSRRQGQGATDEPGTRVSAVTHADVNASASRNGAGEAAAATNGPIASSKPIKRSNSFGRKPAAPPPAAEEPAAISDQERKQQRMLKQAIAATECARAPAPDQTRSEVALGAWVPEGRTRKEGGHAPHARVRRSLVACRTRVLGRLQRYLEKMSEGDQVPEGDDDSRGVNGASDEAQPVIKQNGRPILRAQSFDRGAKGQTQLAPPPRANGWKPYNVANGVPKALTPAKLPPPPPPKSAPTDFDISDTPPPPPRDQRPANGHASEPPPPPLAPAPAPSLSASSITLPKRTLNLARAPDDSLNGSSNGRLLAPAATGFAPAPSGAIRLPRRGESNGSIKALAPPPPAPAASPMEPPPQLPNGAATAVASSAGGEVAAPAAVEPRAASAQPPITYMKPPAGGGAVASGAVPSRTAAAPTDAVRAAPEPTVSVEASAPKVSKGTPLKKRFSFGREKKKEPPPAPPVKAAPPAASKPKSPKGDGEMDDDELDRYLMHLEQNHDRERDEFEQSELAAAELPSYI